MYTGVPAVSHKHTKKMCWRGAEALRKLCGTRPCLSHPVPGPPPFLHHRLKWMKLNAWRLRWLLLKYSIENERHTHRRNQLPRNVSSLLLTNPNNQRPSILCLPKKKKTFHINLIHILYGCPIYCSWTQILVSFISIYTFLSIYQKNIHSFKLILEDSCSNNFFFG